MSDRIELKGDGWCFGIGFFIQLALFEKTGYADWSVESRGTGERDNRTDGEHHHLFWAWRYLAGSADLITDCEVIPPFDVRGNHYSYRSIYESTVKNLPLPRHVNISTERCSDKRALPRILQAYWDGSTTESYCKVLPVKGDGDGNV